MEMKAQVEISQLFKSATSSVFYAHFISENWK